MKELMGEHGIKKLDETESEKISGGYVGKDWNEKYAKAYGELGIKHVRNTFGYDEYYVGGYKVPKEYVYEIFKANEYKNLDDDWGFGQAARYVMWDFEQLKKELKGGKNGRLTEIWEQYS